MYYVLYGVCVLIYDTAHNEYLYIHNEYLLKPNLTVNIYTC